MRKHRRKIAVALGLVFICGLFGVHSFLSNRYPYMTTPEAINYVVNRVTSLANYHVFTRTPYDRNDPIEVELENVRNMAVSIAPGIAEKGDLEKAIILRDMVYKKVPIIDHGQSAVIDRDLDKRVYLQLFNDEYGSLCGGLSLTYMIMLKAFGIPSRSINLLYQVKDAPDPADAHGSVDAYINGQWMAMDPTFNVSISIGDRRLSWAEYRQQMSEDVPIRMDGDGFSPLPGRSVAEYYISMKKLARYMLVGPSPVANSPMTMLPHSWDGTIAYANGKRFDPKEPMLEHPLLIVLAQPSNGS